MLNKYGGKKTGCYGLKKGNSAALGMGNHPYVTDVRYHD